MKPRTRARVEAAIDGACIALIIIIALGLYYGWVLS